MVKAIHPRSSNAGKRPVCPRVSPGFPLRKSPRHVGVSGPGLAFPECRVYTFVTFILW